MIKMLTVAVTVSALLSGCKSTQEFMNMAPRDVFYSKVAPKPLAFCLASQLGAPQQELADGQYLVRGKTIYGGSSEAFTIKPGDGGSVVEYRRAHGLMNIRPTWKKCLSGEITQ